MQSRRPSAGGKYNLVAPFTTCPKQGERAKDSGDFAKGFPLIGLQAFADSSVPAAEGGRNLAQTLSGGLQFPNSVRVHVLAGPPEALAFRTGITDSSTHAFADQVALKLRHGRNYREDRLPKRAGSIEIFLKADELYAQSTEFFKCNKKMAAGSRQPIESPNQNCVKFPLASVGHHLVQLGTVVFGTGLAHVNILADDNQLTGRAV
jgi:hypothetical protein